VLGLRLSPLLLLASGCFGLSLGDEPFVCGVGDSCPSGYECLFNVCTRKGKPDAAPPDGGGVLIDATCSADDFLRCVDTTHAEVCNEDGTGVLAVECPGGCDAAQELCVRCTPNTVTCEGDTLVTCGPLGDVTASRTCYAGCDATEPATCLRLLPKNLPADACAEPGPGIDLFDLKIQQDRELDTSDCAALGGVILATGPSASACVVKVRRFVLDLGVRVEITGTYPLALVALERMEIRGTVDLSGDGLNQGAGAGDGGLGISASNETNNGGGGGGFLAEGATGGGGRTGTGKTSGGPSHGGDTLAPLVGGSAGGKGGLPCLLQTCPFDPPLVNGGAGGGGGALQLVACEQLSLGQLARINAGGGGGPAGEKTGFLGAPGGGGGGGSGGAIAIEAPLVVVPNGTKITATGGGGGGGGNNDSAGTPGGDAEDEAPGIGGPGATGAGQGGIGGAGLGPDGPGSGKDARTDATAAGGGGGGGSAGRIRLAGRPDVAVSVAAGARVVPTPTKASIDRQRED
jgi:hypothetical protein